MPDVERDFVEMLESGMQGAMRESGLEVDDSFLFSIWSTQEAKQIQFMGVLLSACVSVCVLMVFFAKLLGGRGVPWLLGGPF